MTFTEAAVEVLRLVGKPLHYKKITEVAIERNLLSHVGKTPEVTMSSRLATMVKRDRGEAPIIKVKPGVFGLREFNEEQLADLSGDVDELPEVEVAENEQAKPEEAAAEGGEVDLKLTAPPQPRRPLPGADVFPEEEDDDDPILGGDDEEAEEDEDDAEAANGADAGSAGESRSQRRRRKRRRRGGEDAAEEPRAREDRDARELRNGRGDGRGERRPGRDERRGGREERREARDERRERFERRDERREELVFDMSREPADGDLLGKELSDAVVSVLAQSGARGLSALRVADLLVRKGRLSGDPNALLPTVMAAVRADVARRKHEPRPRFRVEGGSLILTEFLLPQDVVRAEHDVLRAAERQRERARRAFLRKVAELPAAGVAELIATWLNAEGVVGLRAVRRPGSSPGELHLAGTLRRGPEEVRLAVVVCRDGRELGREKVIEARGALHYYGGANTAWLITLGSVMSGAREEAAAPASAPVALYDGLALASAMERMGVGLGVQQVAISCLDFELLDALRGAPAGRERDNEFDRHRNRERDRGRDRGERERPRLVLERPVAVSHEPPEPDEVEAAEEDEESAAEEPTELLEEAAAEAADMPAAQGEARESGRRRRRRRRRRGRADEATEAGTLAGEATDLADEEAESTDDDAPEETDELPAEAPRVDAGEAYEEDELARAAADDDDAELPDEDDEDDALDEDEDERQPLRDDDDRD